MIKSKEMKKRSANEEEFGSIVKVLTEREIKTSLKREDLILPVHTRNKIDEIDLWIKNQKELKEESKDKFSLQKGYTTLFYGKALTEKLLTTATLAKKYKKPVHKVDLSLFTAKYIGETEKNLNKIIAGAEKAGAILFFDEADALFGKRTEVRNSNDKFANNEIYYLIQKVEENESLMILSTNLKQNIDEAFIRRFNSNIHFPKKAGIAEKFRFNSGEINKNRP